MNKSYEDDIRLRSVDLLAEETLPNTTCPCCTGGLSNDKSLSITRVDNGLVYNCYRATCGYSGFAPDKHLKHKVVPAGKPHIKLKKGGNKGRTLNPFRGRTVNLSTEQHAFFRTKFGFTTEEQSSLHIRYCPTTLSYAIPIFDRHGYKVGTVDRSWTGRNPKAINHWSVDVPNLYFPLPCRSANGPVVVVEDFASAIKVNRYQYCVALLGTNIGLQEAALLRKVSNRLVIALDPDATKKAVALSKKYNLLFDDIFVQSLSKDPKDMDDDALRAAFNRRYP